MILSIIAIFLFHVTEVIQCSSSLISKPYIEILLINDYSRILHFDNEQDLRHNTLTLAKLVSERFKRDLGVYVVVSDIVNAGLSLNPENIRPSASELISQVIHYVKERNLTLYDHVQLLTMRNVYVEGEQTANGLARVGSMCNEDSVSVVETAKAATMDSTANTMAHEIGHALKMPHDAEGESLQCRDGIMESNSCLNCDDEKYKRFSLCSISIAKSFIPSRACLSNIPEKRLRCGNGVIDAFEGEECDDSKNPCCDKNSCTFVENSCEINGSLGKCLAGKCEPTCGNGKLEPNEDCDPLIMSNGCCDPVTCKFKNAGNSCSSGVCNGGNKCVAKPDKALPDLQVVIVPNIKDNSYSVRFSDQNDAPIYITFDNTTPVNISTSSSILYSTEFRFGLQNITDANEKFVKKYPTFSSPFRTNEKGEYLVILQGKAYKEGFYASPLYSYTLSFPVKDDDFPIGLIAGAVFSVIALLFVLSYVIIWRTRKFGRNGSVLSVRVPYQTKKRATIPKIRTDISSDSDVNVTIYSPSSCVSATTKQRFNLSAVA